MRNMKSRSAITLLVIGSVLLVAAAFQTQLPRVRSMLIVHVMRSQNPYEMKALLWFGANPNQNLDGASLLVNAVIQTNCSADVVDLLLNAGANLNIREPKAGMLPITLAALHGQEKCFGKLFDYEGHLDVQDLVGVDLLQAALIGKNRKIVRRILEVAGWNVNLPNMQGQTAIFFSAALGDQAISRSLLEHGADLCVIDRFSQFPSDKAECNGYHELAAALKCTKSGAAPTVNREQGGRLGCTLKLE